MTIALLVLCGVLLAALWHTQNRARQQAELTAKYRQAWAQLKAEREAAERQASHEHYEAQRREARRARRAVEQDPPALVELLERPRPAGPRMWSGAPSGDPRLN